MSMDLFAAVKIGNVVWIALFGNELCVIFFSMIWKLEDQNLNEIFGASMENKKLNLNMMALSLSIRLVQIGHLWNW